MLNASKRSTYRSKTTQKELINICGNLISNKLTREIKKAQFFSVMADEAAGVSNSQQMSLVIRFVDESSTNRESFLGFVRCSDDLSGKGISEKILASEEDHGLDMSLCRGQGYDGAGNMAGKIRGAATRIQKQHPKAFYVLCGSHLLNLAVAPACSIQEISNTMEHMKSVTDFFNCHAKHGDLLCGKMKAHLPSSRHSRLIDVCRTRLLARLDGLDIFLELFIPIVAAVVHVQKNHDGSWNPDIIKKASWLFYTVVSFEFIVTLIIVYRLLGVTRPLAKQLQAASLDAVSAMEKVTLLFVTLKRIRKDIDEMHGEWYDEAVDIASSIGTPPCKPRTVDVQVHRCNVPSASFSEFYKRSLSIPFLDHLQSQIEVRFSERNLKVLHANYAFPSKILTHPNWHEKFSVFLKEYNDDLPELGHLSLELKMWEENWLMFKGTPPSTLSTLLPATDKLTFRNIYNALKIAATIPVTSCDCERSISVLRRFKTRLRSTMLR